jgi:hypothetical protein
MVGCRRQSGLAHSNVMNVAWNCKHTLCTEVAHSNCLTGSLNIYVNKTPVPDFGILFIYLSIGGKLYYNRGLSLNESINLTSTGL